MPTPEHVANLDHVNSRIGRSVTLRSTANYGAVLFSGLFAGFLVTVLVLEASLRDANAAVYTQVRLIELDSLGDLASVLLVPAILATAALAFIFFRRRGSGRWLVAVALVLLVITFAISLSISVPINTAQQSWAVVAPPGNWADVRDRWQLAHAVRTTTAVLAFLLLLATPFCSPQPGRSTDDSTRLRSGTAI